MGHGARRAAAVAVAAVVVALAACGGDDDEAGRATTTTAAPGTTSTTTGYAGNAGVPEETAQTLVAIRAAAAAGDLDALASLALAGDGPFTASFGGEFDDPDELAAFWARQEEEGQPITEVLVALLDLPDWYETTSLDAEGEETPIYVTPRFMHEQNPETRAQLEEAIGADRLEASVADGQYLGWRLGITAGGHWQFFVAGD